MKNLANLGIVHSQLSVDSQTEFARTQNKIDVDSNFCPLCISNIKTSFKEYLKREREFGGLLRLHLPDKDKFLFISS
jgi:hypothetical protein